MENDKTVLVNFDGDMSLDQAYLELGKAYYEGRFEDPLPELLPLFDRITRLCTQTISQETEIQQKGLESKEPQKMPDLSHESSRPTFCPGCGERLEPDAIFCGNCGYRVG